MSFPYYRKYVGQNVWFKIVSPDEFIEVKHLGEKKLVTHVKTYQFPEKVFIQDMIACHQGRWEELSSDLDYLFNEHV